MWTPMACLSMPMVSGSASAVLVAWTCAMPAQKISAAAMAGRSARVALIGVSPCGDLER
jgi:hypothetical protein